MGPEYLALYTAEGQTNWLARLQGFPGLRIHVSEYLGILMGPEHLANTKQSILSSLA